MTIKVPTPRGSQKRLTDYNNNSIYELQKSKFIQDVRVVTSKRIDYINRRSNHYFNLGYKTLSSGWIGGDYNQSVFYLESK